MNHEPAIDCGSYGNRRRKRTYNVPGWHISGIVGNGL
ncbi:MAG TPA: hypothetical protein [Bacteriophage sp.]|nr:MAG TPA: hypothetical protein [Bacteriophage sp.]DAN22070.1 MAG TPA_asm: hypothetical protein [Bacteriophage sp.]DAV69458.1 MAG TPA: hypothetical protein [Bacteriophage sp.]